MNHYIRDSIDGQNHIIAEYAEHMATQPEFFIPAIEQYVAAVREKFLDPCDFSQGLARHLFAGEYHTQQQMSSARAVHRMSPRWGKISTPARHDGRNLKPRNDDHIMYDPKTCLDNYIFGVTSAIRIDYMLPDVEEKLKFMISHSDVFIPAIKAIIKTHCVELWLIDDTFDVWAKMRWHDHKKSIAALKQLLEMMQ